MRDSNPSDAGLLVVTRFRVPADRFDAFAAQAREAIAALGACAGFVGAELGQSTDEAELRLISTRWTGIGAYRRALSDFTVKMTAIPFLSLAIDEPSAFEIVHARTPAGTRDAASGLAADARHIGLGEASADHVPPVAT